MAEHGDTTVETELLTFVVRRRYRLFTLAVVKGHIGQIGYLALHGEEKRYLEIFTAHLGITEK